MSGDPEIILADVQLTTKISLTGGKAKAIGRGNLIVSDNLIEIKGLILNQTSCNSSFFIYKTLNLKDVVISNIDKKSHIAHLKATIELSEPKSEENKGGEIFSRLFSFFASKAPLSRTESVDIDVPFEMNEDESKVKVRFSTMGLSQKITASMI